MRILVVGGRGTIGRAVTAALEPANHVLAAGRSHGDVRVDIASPESIRAMYRDVGRVDAVVSCAGSAAFKPLLELTDDDFAFSLGNKLMGQVNLVRLGLDALADGGCFVLTSGILAREPIAGAAAISLVNAGLEGFAGAAALDMPRGLRVNVVSPPWVAETLEAMGKDAAGGLPARVVARAYLAALEPARNGQVLNPREFA